MIKFFCIVFFFQFNIVFGLHITLSLILSNYVKLIKKDIYGVIEGWEIEIWTQDLGLVG